MYEITRRFKKPPFNGSPHEFTVYEVDEAQRHGIIYVSWREGQPGDWIETDDGYIAEIISRTTYTTREGKKRDFVKASFADFWVPGNKSLKFKTRMLEKRWGGSGKSWIEHEIRRTRTKNAVTAYVAFVIAGKKPDWYQIGVIYRSDQKDPAASARRLFRQQKVQTMAADRIREIIIGEGIDERAVLKMLKQTFDEAKKNGHTAVMRHIAKDFAELIGLTADRIQSEWWDGPEYRPYDSLPAENMVSMRPPPPKLVGS